MTKRVIIHCSVSGDKCSSPAGYRIGGLGGACGENEYTHAIFECYACGQPVCGRCSKNIEYLNYGKQRICDNCREE